MGCVLSTEAEEYRARRRLSNGKSRAKKVAKRERNAAAASAAATSPLSDDGEHPLLHSSDSLARMAAAAAEETPSMHSLAHVSGSPQGAPANPLEVSPSSTQTVLQG